MKTQEQVIPMNMVRVCVHSKGTYDAAGIFFSKLSDRGIWFISVADLLLKMDRLLDRGGRPQAFQAKRSFQEERTRNTEDFGKKAVQAARTWNAAWAAVPQMEDEEILTQQGTYATYDIIVQSRMHSSMQGIFKDGTGRYLGTFESDLQLMRLMLIENEKRSSFAASL